MKKLRKKMENGKIKEAVRFLIKYKKRVLLGCFIVVVLGVASLFLMSRYKNKSDQAQPVGLIDQYKKELPELEKKAQSGNPNDLQQYGIALYATGNLAKAEETYKKQIEKDGNNPMLHNNLANALRDQKKFDEAVKEYEKAIELNPQSANSYLNLASVYQYSLNDFDKAMEVYQKAIASNSKNPDFLNMAALAYEQKGDKEKAKEFFKKVLDLQEENAAAQAGLERLKN